MPLNQFDKGMADAESGVVVLAQLPLPAKRGLQLFDKDPLRNRLFGDELCERVEAVLRWEAPCAAQQARDRSFIAQLGKGLPPPLRTQTMAL